MKNRSTILVMAVAVLLIFSGLVSAQTEDFDFLFNCDMEVQMLAGTFVPGTDTVDVRGSFNGWSGPSDILTPNVFDPNLYQTIVRINLAPVGGNIEYKFVITNSTGTLWEGIDNRTYTTDGTETDLNGDGIKDVVLDTVYWGDIGPDDIFTQEKDIVFEVDMRPAHAFLADSGAITFGGGNVTAVDSLYLAGGAPNTTPTLAWVWDLPEGDPTRLALQMNDGGTNGDLVAGDSIWAITVTFHVGAPKDIVWKYGINGWDNEAGFAENHSGNVDVPSGRVGNCFGSNSVGAGLSNWYAPYQGSCVLVGVEPDDLPDVSSSFQLHQNYPNPFNPSTKIEYQLGQRSYVQVTIYNLLGQQVRTLVNNVENPGLHQVLWDGKNDLGQSVGSGVYLYRMTAGKYSETRKMVLMK